MSTEFGRLGNQVVQLIRFEGGQILQIPFSPGAALQASSQLAIHAAECVGEMIFEEAVAGSCMDCQVKLTRKRTEAVALSRPGRVPVQPARRRLRL